MDLHRFRYHGSGKARRAAAIVLVLGAAVLMPGASRPGFPLWNASVEARAALAPEPTEGAETSPVPLADIEADRLWEAQPGLVAKATGALKPRIAGRSNVYAMAVAAGGAQQLFAREARLALQVAAARFGADYRGGLLLSNGLADILHAPLATRANMTAAARGIGGHLDRRRDIALLYLVSHGSADATLSTELPNQKLLIPISSASVARALGRAGIKRRIIIISACYSGTWIPALASADSIVIAAAREDRTSFGCDDTRRLTYFGEALLEGPLAHGASLHDAFETARNKVARWEADENLTPSEPQVYVGRNMRAFWLSRAPTRGKGQRP